MSFAVVGVGLGTAAIGAGASIYSANKQSKAAKQAAGGANGPNRPFEAPEMPAYVPYNGVYLNGIGVNQDKSFYGASDADFKKRHSGLLGAEKLFEAQTLKDQQGDTELLPALQGEFMRAGLVNSLGAFGDSSSIDGTSTSGTLAPGSAGEASVARNLGVSIMGLQDRNRANRIASLTTAESLFPRRSFGLSGADAVNIELANTAGQNNWNQTDYANKFQTDQYNYLVGAKNQEAAGLQHNQGVMADAAKKGAIWSGVFNSLGSAAGAYGAYKSGAPAASAAITKPVKTTV